MPGVRRGFSQSTQASMRVSSEPPGPGLGLHEELAFLPDIGQ
jgi:hypothetical protein